VTRPAIDPELRALILDALDAPYLSESTCDGTATGNHYQSVSLRGEATTGFRSARSEILESRFTGKRCSTSDRISVNSAARRA
jgi:hypothetical protein